MAVFIGERGEGIRLHRRASGHGANDEQRQREGDKATQLTRALWEGGDEHKSEDCDEHSGTGALFAWPCHARARCSELQRRRALGRS